MSAKCVDVPESLGNKVVKDNILIQKAKTNLTLNEQKLINFLISLIKPGDKDFQTYSVKITDFSALTGIDNKHVYRDFKKIIDGIDEKAFWFENEKVLEKIHWVIAPKYLKEKGTVEVRLHPDIKSYLLELRGNFTEYELYNILSLKTKYSINLYELFKSHSFKQSFVIDIDELKESIDASNKSYKHFGMFRMKVLEKALDDINEYTDISVSYVCMDSAKREMNDLRGSRVSYIKFLIKPKSELERITIFGKVSNRVVNNDQLSDQVPHQISFDTDNETTALFDETTNQQIN